MDTITLNVVDDQKTDDPMIILPKEHILKLVNESTIYSKGFARDCTLYWAAIPLGGE